MAVIGSGTASAMELLGVDGRGVADHPGESVLFSVDSGTGVGTSLGVLQVPSEPNENAVGAPTLSPDGELYAIEVKRQKLLGIDQPTYDVCVMGVVGDWPNERVDRSAFRADNLAFLVADLVVPSASVELVVMVPPVSLSVAHVGGIVAGLSTALMC